MNPRADVQESDVVCECGHPWEAHELVEGFTCSPGVTIGGRSFVPDIWVCSGGRLADINDPDISPWDFVCGCILHKELEVKLDA